MLSTSDLLPGVTFVTAVPPISEALPRMDIPAFVGFATAGPVNTPVPIEDVARFREIFREDVQLAWDNERKEPQYSYLGQAVASFFHTGGRRCWVLRISGNSVQSACFSLAHVVPMDSAAQLSSPPAQFREANIRARSPGIWGEEMRVGTLLRRDSLGVQSGEMSVVSGFEQGPICLGEDAKTFHISLISTPADLRVQDLLRITFSTEGPVLFLFVNRIQQNSLGLTISGTVAFWFVCESIHSLPIATMVIEGDPCQKLIPIDAAEGKSWLENWYNTSQPQNGPHVDRLRFDLLVWRHGRLDQKFTDLAFSKNHPRFWANLPSDDDLFRLSKGRESRHFEPEIEGLRQQANSPRFDLAGPENDGLPEYCLPINMPETINDSLETAKGPRTVGHGSVQERNGIDCFDTGLFIDENLQDVGAGMLLQEANHKYYIRQETLRGIHSLLPVEEVTLIAVPDAVHRPWSLDAEPVPSWLEAPVLEPVSGPDRYRQYTLAWSEVHGATRYLVQRSDLPDFPEPVNHFVERPVLSKFDHPYPYPSDTAPDTELKLTLPFKCARSQYFRIRSERYGEISAWSNTRGRILPPRDFTHCDTPRPANLELDLDSTRIGSPAGGYRLFWKIIPTREAGTFTIEEYELQSSLDSGFLSANSRIIRNEDYFEFSPPNDAVIYYRVRAWCSRTAGPWSNTVRIAARFLSTHTLQPIKDYNGEDLRTIHRALFRFCAARGDMIAVLSLPRHFRCQDVLDHIRACRTNGNASIAVSTNTTDTALSYAALYHPWLASSTEVHRSDGAGFDPVRFCPPEGAVIGTMANLAITQGAWLAPANQLLNGTFALEPDFSIDQWRRLTTAGANLIRKDPRGFMVLNADTLCRQKEFRLLNVRRLLILLHRLTLREGNRYVFESNDSDFRSAVQHYFEKTLSDMYVRGAFTGRTQDEAFRVVTDDSVNTILDIDRGRFIVELQIAPSKPITFIHIRLVQTGSGQLEVQEF